MKLKKLKLQAMSLWSFVFLLQSAGCLDLERSELKDAGDTESSDDVDSSKVSRDTEAIQASDTDTDVADADVPDDQDSDTESESDLDAGPGLKPDVNTDMDTDTTTTTSTSPSCIEETLRCSGTGSPARDICKEGQFVATTSCGENEVCDSRKEAVSGTCAPLAEICRGNANSAACEEANLHLCSPDSVELSVTACESKRHCQLGISKGQCAICLPGTFKCEERQLKKCDDTGNSWTDEKLCDRADLCNPDIGTCTDLTCLPGGKKCDGDNLMVCNDNQTGFILETQCGKELCNPSELRCDVCLPDEHSCNDDSDGYRVCNTGGLAYTDADCSTSQPYCVGAGTCTQCIEDKHCTVANICEQAICNATGVCGAQNRLAGTGTCKPTTASSGVCDGKGGCTECITAENCSTDYCVSNICRTCDGPCSVGKKCNRDIDCASSKCEGNLCRPSCSGSCGVGEVCTKSDDCASGECDSETNRCTKTCGNVVITTNTTYNNARDCVVINGDLEINHAAAPQELEFPYLKTITGKLDATFTSTATESTIPPNVTALDMPMLLTVGGEVNLSSTLIERLGLPKLTSVGGALFLAGIPAEEILLPNLETVGERLVFSFDETTKLIDLSSLKEALYVYLIELSALADLKLNKIEKVTDVTLYNVFYLPYEKVERLVEKATGTVTVSGIGCCLLVRDAKMGCDDVNLEGKCTN